MSDERLIEVMAKAICRDQDGGSYCRDKCATCNPVDVDNGEPYRLAQAALQAIRAEGLVVVPREPTEDKDLYYVQDKRNFVGNSMSWWAVDGKGYICDIRKAHVWTKEEAYAQYQCRETDVPWPKAYIDSIISHHIDHQDTRSYNDYKAMIGEEG